jgi:DNA-binding response OmpR family regulator
MVRIRPKISGKPTESRPKAEVSARGRAATMNRVRILIVEDEAGLVSALRVALQREGYAVDGAHTLAEAGEKLPVIAYDLVLLDVNLPDGCGFDLATGLRTGRLGAPGAPPPKILMLTARGGLDDRVKGLDHGADDYLVKPFAIAELSARIRALLRRDSGEGTALLGHGPVRMDIARHLAWRGERELQLTLKEFSVLRYLMSRPGYVVAAEELLEHVWDENADPFTQTVRVTVGTLRRKLTVDGEAALLETVIGRGYRLRLLDGTEQPA